LILKPVSDSIMPALSDADACKLTDKMALLSKTFLKIDLLLIVIALK